MPAFPPSFAHTNQQQIRCPCVWRQWEGTAHHCTGVQPGFSLLWKRLQLNKRWHLSFNRKHCISLISLLVWVWVLFFFFLFLFRYVWVTSWNVSCLVRCWDDWRPSFVYRLTKSWHLLGFRKLSTIHIALMYTHKDISWKLWYVTNSLVFWELAIKT